jgi:hypothetical protein
VEEVLVAGEQEDKDEEDEESGQAHEADLQLGPP